MKAKLTLDSNLRSARCWRCRGAGSTVQRALQGGGAAHFKAQGTSILCVKIERKLYLGMAALDNPVEGNVVEHLE